MKKMLIPLLILVILCANVHSFAEPHADTMSPLPVKVLLLPKFEVGDMTGDFPGEAQEYFEHYLTGAEEYDVPYASAGTKLYYKNGIALCVLGMGKVRAALNTMAFLLDRRFDYSQAYIISTGCAGSAAGSTVMGDVFVITSAIISSCADIGSAIATPSGTGRPPA